MFGERFSRWERILYLVILVLAIVSRFYLLGNRAMSHDESLHTKYSWMLYAGQGYQHNPMMHGPSLFHFTALAYFMLGVSDGAARVFPAIFGTALVMLPLLFRKYLGRNGALLASFMLLISPAISYHSRYIRHDVFLMTSAVVVLWAILQYLEDGQDRWLYLFAGFFALMYTTMEGYYIYTAFFGILLAVPFIRWAASIPWERPDLFWTFLGTVILVVILLGATGAGLLVAKTQQQALDAAGNAQVANILMPIWARVTGMGLVPAILAAMGIAFYGIGENRVRQVRLFDVLMLVGSLILPLGSALLIWIAGVDMLQIYQILLSQNFSQLLSAPLVISVIIISLTIVTSVLIGLWWDARRWPRFAAVFWAIFMIFYTTIFTNPGGALSGLVGALAYWLAQQGVERGGQPQYYYVLMMGVYEYLPLLVSIGVGVAALVQWVRSGFAWVAVARPSPAAEEDSNLQSELEEELDLPASPGSFFPWLLGGWMVLAWIAFSYAGERMPWLTVHIALPSILLSAWGLNWMLSGMDWKRLWQDMGWLAFPAIPLFIGGGVMLTLAILNGSSALASGIALDQLNALNMGLGAALGLIFAAGILFWAVPRAGWSQIWRAGLLSLVFLLALCTVRTMTTFNYINYDLAREFMVYAHSTPDVKVALGQIDEVSWRTTGAVHDVEVAYSEDGSWPLAWYMVDYPNAYFYGTSPDATRLQGCPVVIAGREQWEVVEPILGPDYMYFNYKYLWWPIQDYWNLDGGRISFALNDPTMRMALWEIFWNRDYKLYGEATGQDLSAQSWPLRRDFRLYVRRDTAHDLWGIDSPTIAASPTGEGTAAQPTADPYILGAQPLTGLMTANLLTASPRGIALGADGSIYVSDSLNNKIWQISSQGMVINSWGDPGTGPGQFSEPWGIAVDASGNVYVADTWNHRIQKFDRQGKYLLSWGASGLVSVDDPAGAGYFYGPRGVAVGPDGNIYVTDTGNKRVEIFTSEGQFVRQFGGSGSAAGQMEEPVGIAVTSDGQVVVADTWNGRIQLFSKEGQPVRQWAVSTWGRNNPEEKPYLALTTSGTVLVGDPVNARILAFAADGTFLWSSGGSDQPSAGLTFPEGLAVSSDGTLYVADAHSGRVVGLRLP